MANPLVLQRMALRHVGRSAETAPVITVALLMTAVFALCALALLLTAGPRNAGSPVVSPTPIPGSCAPFCPGGAR